MREAVTYSQRLSITLRYLATGNNFEDLKLKRFTAQSTGIIALDVFTARQTDSD
jgi:hypothetical protein